MWLSKYLETEGLPFERFVEAALYDPDHGYYSAPRAGLDYATSVDISPAFAFALGRLAEVFLARAGDGVSSIVDIGCGDGSLLAGIRAAIPAESAGNSRFIGIDRSLERLRPEHAADPRLEFAGSMDALPREGSVLVLSNELFDAVPFARLVRRNEGLRELRVVERNGSLDWDEGEASAEHLRYFEERGIELEPGQFADIAIGWSSLYAEIASRVERGMIVTIDYGFEQTKLFDVRVRRYGTAAAFRRHRLTRDLLASPGEQDLTAHVNLTDLERAGEALGWRTLLLTRQARFLLSLGITAHPLLAPLDGIETDAAGAAELVAMREAARALVLPDGIGDEMRVLVQSRGVAVDGWPFESTDFR